MLGYVETNINKICDHIENNNLFNIIGNEYFIWHITGNSVIYSFSTENGRRQQENTT